MRRTFATAKSDCSSGGAHFVQLDELHKPLPFPELTSERKSLKGGEPFDRLPFPWNYADPELTAPGFAFPQPAKARPWTVVHSSCTACPHIAIRARAVPGLVPEIEETP